LEEEDEVFTKPRSRHWRKADSSLESKIRQQLSAQNHEELVEWALALVRRFPQLREEFKESIALSEGNVSRLIADARKKLRSVSSERGWHNDWRGEGYTPDYKRFKQRLERLVEHGAFDAVVDLGRELIRCGLEQVEQSDDEGETATAIAERLPVVFQAVLRSSLSAPEKILFAIDADLDDDYDLVGSICLLTKTPKE
jgi:hypothetical protein